MKPGVIVVVPPRLVIEIGPVVAAAGTVAVMKFTLTTLNVALTPLNVTAVVPMKLLPRIKTFEPTADLTA